MFPFPIFISTNLIKNTIIHMALAYLFHHGQQKRRFFNLLYLEPLVGFEPTTPRLQITCSGQLS